MNKPNKKLFLITGVTSGFGDAFAKAALAAGHSVAGTMRQKSYSTAFEEIAPGRARAVVLDVTDFDAIEPAVKRIVDETGPIDVLVNNAGYGHEGILEESPLAEIHRQFDVNVFGSVAMIKAVEASLRAHH